MKQEQATRKNIRKLKVYYETFNRGGYWIGSSSVTFPVIRLCGKWLRNSGFEVGQQVAVLCEKNKITITLNESETSVDSTYANEDAA